MFRYQILFKYDNKVEERMEIVYALSPAKAVDKLEERFKQLGHEKIEILGIRTINWK